MLKTIELDDWLMILNNAQVIGSTMIKSLEKNSLDDYTNQMYVYMKHLDPYGNEVIKHKSKGARTTYWVPLLQK